MLGSVFENDGKKRRFVVKISFLKTENETTSVRLVVLVRKRNERLRFNLSFSKHETKRQLRQKWRFMIFVLILKNIYFTSLKHFFHMREN